MKIMNLIEDTRRRVRPSVSAGSSLDVLIASKQISCELDAKDQFCLKKKKKLPPYREINNRVTLYRSAAHVACLLSSATEVVRIFNERCY